MRAFPILGITVVVAVLGACTLEVVSAAPPFGPTPPAGISLFGTGYRGPGDLCRRAGETDFTNQLLSDNADLVACPPGTDPRLFVFESGGREVARRDSWILFTVPVR